VKDGRRIPDPVRDDGVRASALARPNDPDLQRRTIEHFRGSLLDARDLLLLARMEELW
jgi:hypothetical protein